MTVKDIILTAIYFKGVEQVKREAKDLAEKALCSQSYIRSIIRQVEKSSIIINKQ